jgi:hypothetical protein
MTTTIFEARGGKALYYAGDLLDADVGGTIFEMGSGRPVYYRGSISSVIYDFRGRAVFWIVVAVEAPPGATPPLGGLSGHLLRYDRGPPMYFEEGEDQKVEAVKKLFGAVEPEH